MPLACLVLALAALPLALVQVPPLLDYPNHLARIWLLAGGMHDPPLSAIYAADWSGASTNIGVDLLAATLGRNSPLGPSPRSGGDRMTTDAPPTPVKPPAEFDAYAPGYAAGMENPLKAVLGETAEQYVALKLRWLLRHFPSLRSTEAPMRVLDYGCGTATLLRLMAGAGVTASLAGSDISGGMLAEAERQWPERLRGARPDLRAQHGERTPFPDGGFDLVVISAVLHHVPPERRPGVYAELCRVARPGGRIVVFEHNPLNPVTRYVVARTPIDRDAVLLRAREVEQDLVAAGATDPRTCYIMFAPPRLRALEPLERALGWLPLGAQYVVAAAAGPRPV